MRAARERILASVRSSLNRGRIGADLEAELRARIAAHRRNPIPARAATLDHRAQVDLFVTMAEEVQATVARVSSLAAVPEAVAHYLAAENLPAELVMAPDPSLDAIPWRDWPLLQIRRGRAHASDQVSLTGCHAAVADTHIVLVEANQVFATYEDGWDRLCARGISEVPPRTINFITGPSRTADIEQHIELGAHGPRRLHIVLVEGKQASGSDDGEQDSPPAG